MACSHLLAQGHPCEPAAAVWVTLSWKPSSTWLLPPLRLDPIEVAPDTFVLRAAQAVLGAPLSVNTNAMVIRAAEPVVVDTVGQLTVTSVGDAFCFEIDYQEQDKELSGTVRAPVFEQS